MKRITRYIVQINWMFPSLSVSVFLVQIFLSRLDGQRNGLQAFALFEEVVLQQEISALPQIRVHLQAVMQEILEIRVNLGLRRRSTFGLDVVDGLKTEREIIGTSISLKTFRGASSMYGGSPSSISMIMIPNDQISIFSSYWTVLFTTSGAIQ